MIVEELIGRLSFDAKGTNKVRDAAKEFAALKRVLQGFNSGIKLRLDGPVAIARQLKAVTDAARRAQAAQKAIGSATFGQANASAERHIAVVTRLGAAYRHAAGQARALTSAGQAGPSWAQREIAHLRDYAALMKQVANDSRRVGQPKLGSGRVTLGGGGSGLPPLTRYGRGPMIGGPGYGYNRVENRATRATVEAVGDAGEERARQSAAGMTANEKATLRKRALDLSSKYPSVGATEIEALGRAARNAVPNFAAAVEFTEDLTKLQVALQSSRGVDKASETITRFVKSLDVMGRLENLDEARKIINGVVKATNVEGKDLSPADFLTMARYAKSAGASLSPEYLTTDAATLMQDMGASQVGTALGTMISQMIAGRATTKSKRDLEQAGLADWNLTKMSPEQAQAAQLLGVRTGSGIVDPQQLAKDPTIWAQKYLIPALQKKGVDTSNDAAVVSEMSKLFSAQTVANLWTKTITQMPQLLRNRELYAKAQGIDQSAETAVRENPKVMVESAMQGPLNVVRQFIDALTPATSAVTSFTSSLGNNVAKWLASSPEAAVPVAGATLAAGTYATAKLSGAVISKTAEIAGKGWQEGVNTANASGKPTTSLASKVGGVLRKLLPPVAAISEVARVSQSSSLREVAGIPETPQAVLDARPRIQRQAEQKLDPGTLERAQRSTIEFRRDPEAKRGRERLDTGVQARKAAQPTAYPDRESAVGLERMRMKFDGSAVEAALDRIKAGAGAVAESLNMQGKVDMDDSALDRALGKAKALRAEISAAASEAAAAGSAASAAGARLNGLVKGSNGFTAAATTP